MDFETVLECSLYNLVPICSQICRIQKTLYVYNAIIQDRARHTTFFWYLFDLIGRKSCSIFCNLADIGKGPNKAGALLDLGKIQDRQTKDH